MKILIGTPIHQIKDYCMERWLENVTKLRLVYPADFLMVDNSPGFEYVEKVKEYCKKYGLENYKLIHIDVDPDSVLDEKLAQAREIIRQEVLTMKYDAWFSWECDIIIPVGVFDKLIRLSKSYFMIGHAYPSRGYPSMNAELGLTLVNRNILEKFSFLHGYGNVDPAKPNCSYGGDVWFCVWVRRHFGRKYTHVYKNTMPIYHLNE